MLKQLDQVIILTTERVRWLSAPPNSTATPQGVWTVMGVIGTDILVSKENTILRIPYRDVKLFGRYDKERVIQQIKGMQTYGKEKRQEARARFRFVGGGPETSS